MSQPNPALHVTLDAGPAVHQSAGLARYAERLAAQLLANHTDEVELTLFYNAHSAHTLPLSLHNAPTRTVRQNQLTWRLSSLASQLLRLPLYDRAISSPSRQSPNRPILYHATEHLLPYLHCPTVLTVHDLIFERIPEHHTLRNQLFLRLAMPRFVKAADAIIAVSWQTKRDLIQLYNAPADKIHVIYEGIDARFQPAAPAEVARVKALHSPQRPYLLMVGTLEPRKNHATAIRALARLKQQGVPHQLLIVGGLGWMFEPVHKLLDELRMNDDVHFAGYVPNEDLAALYSGADAVLLPSLYEGFGFTVLEAMACGAPVICSNVSSLPEVAGKAALMTPPEDEEALAAAIQRILTEPGLADSLRQKGAARAALFRWERCAQETVAVYQAVAGG